MVVKSSISFLQRFTKRSIGPNTAASLASNRPPPRLSFASACSCLKSTGALEEQPLMH